MNEYITIEGRGGSFSAYIARPKTSPASAVVVLQELFGVNADIREHCDKLAEQGYLAVAPDLYWRLEPGVDLSVRSKEDWDHGVRLNQAYNRDTGAMDVKDAIDAVAGFPECNGRVALLVFLGSNYQESSRLALTGSRGWPWRCASVLENLPH